MSHEHPAPTAPPPARGGRFNPGAALAALIFIAIGILFLLDTLDTTDIRRELVWPAMLIALGLAVMLSALWRSRRR